VALTYFIYPDNSQFLCGFPVSSRGADSVLVDLLKKMNRHMEAISKKLDRLVELQRSSGGQMARPNVSLPEDMPLDVTTLLSLPDHLRKSALALATLREATATDLSKETGRVRAVESDYLNQLVSMGLVKKKRKGRDVYFYVET
jgi:Sugar-specific transcriptional regulator TrmB